MKNIHPIFLFLMIPFWNLFAQPMYNMQNLTVDDCEGILLDSEAGDVAGTYDHNENFTFSICVPDVDEIIMDFTSFCTEDGFDSLRIYDGPDTLSTLLGTFMGTEDPPTMIATSGCLTLNFISDPNVACTGWLASWTTEFEEPQPVRIEPIGLVSCESNEVILTFEEPIPCDSVYAEAFSISGPIFPEIIAATPSPCTNGFTNTVTLTLDPPIDFSGDYEIIFTNVVTICEEEFILQSTSEFSVIDCPLQVEILLDSEAGCAGETATLIAEGRGGNPANYSYQWSVFAPDTNQIDVTVWGPTWYSVTLTDGLATAVDSILVEPNSLPTIIPGDTSFCQSVDPFVFQVWPPGGTWSGHGIGDGEEDSGLYDPNIVPYPRDTLYYEDDNGCENFIFIDIIPLDIGTDDASCPHADTFSVSGGLPLGGIWSGEHILPNGIFTPDTAGSFEVTYTHPNGCSGSKWVNVDSIALPPIDSLCQSDFAFDIPVTPFGGIWSGTGITDEDLGRFDPNEANSGNNELIYEINGCIDTMNIHVTRINARGNFSACPDQAPFIVYGNWQPQGVGVWSGYGIIDSISGLYDPSLSPQVRDTLWFEANGCVDFRIAFVIQTDIGVEDTLRFCPEDEPYNLNRPNTTINPRRGVWSGPGVMNPDEFIYDFHPDLAGTGIHTLYYERNTCIDSLKIEVYPTPQIVAEEFCDAEPARILQVDLPNITWSGDGIINEQTGVFDPGEAGEGIHTIYAESEFGCVGENDMTVIPFVHAGLDGIGGFYCYQNTDIPISIMPPGGTLTLNGDTISNPIFNPALVGTGNHLFQYTIGEDACEDSEAVLVEVGEAVTVSLPLESDTLCMEQSTTISAVGEGGSSFGNYTYTWNQGLGFGQFQLVTPSQTTTYTVTVDDGCSDPAIGEVTVYMHLPIFLDYVTGEPVCFEDTTFAELYAFPGDAYTFEWNTTPPTFGNILESNPRSYLVEVTDNETGCFIEEEVVLPGWDLLQANFDISPKNNCVTTLDPTVQILDFSVGATVGEWDFGDGITQPYIFGENLFYTFPDTGNYVIKLKIQNEGGCVSEYEIRACVKPEHRLFAPNALTPNKDGKNDFFKLVGQNIEEVTWQIANRYGEILFVGESMDDEWDGTYKGEFVPQGSYVFQAVYRVKEARNEQVLRGMVVVIY